MTPTVILPHVRARVSRTDLSEIRRRIERLEPGIDFRPFDVFWPPDWLPGLAGRSALCLSLNVVKVRDLLDHVHGPKLIARPVHKLEQLERLRKAGVPVPHTAVLEDGLEIGEERFGRHVMIKTTANGTHRGEGITLMRTEAFNGNRCRLAAWHRASTDAGAPAVVQAFVPTGPHPTHVRVLCFFGRPILMYRTTARHGFDPDATESAGAEATSNAAEDRIRRLEDDAEIAALGARAADAFPETPVVGIDIVRSAEDGRLFVIEANMGNIAPFSSGICSRLRADLGGAAALARQFGAYDVIAGEIVRRALSPRAALSRSA